MAPTDESLPQGACTALQRKPSGHSDRSLGAAGGRANYEVDNLRLSAQQKEQVGMRSGLPEVARRHPVEKTLLRAVAGAGRLDSSSPELLRFLLYEGGVSWQPAQVGVACPAYGAALSLKSAEAGHGAVFLWCVRGVASCAFMARRSSLYTVLGLRGI